MAEELDRKWESEFVPDLDLLFMRVHRVNLDENGNPLPGAFRNHPTKKDGMSTDWDRYSTAADTRSRGRNPSDNAVVKMKVGQVRRIPEQQVIHTPDLENQNRAHTDVFGEKDKNKNPQARLMFMRIAIIQITVENR